MLHVTQIKIQILNLFLAYNESNRIEHVLCNKQNETKTNTNYDVNLIRKAVSTYIW
jgi:hypothetical protein